MSVSDLKKMAISAVMFSDNSTASCGCEDSCGCDGDCGGDGSMPDGS